MNTAQALKVIELEHAPSNESDEIVNFISKSERGILKGPDLNASFDGD